MVLPARGAAARAAGAESRKRPAPSERAAAVTRREEGGDMRRRPDGGLVQEDGTGEHAHARADAATGAGGEVVGGPAHGAVGAHGHLDEDLRAVGQLLLAADGKGFEMAAVEAGLAGRGHA